MTKKSAIDNKNAKALVIDLFDRIHSSKTIEDLNLIPKELDYGDLLVENMPSEKIYPRLRLRITKEEVDTLMQMGVLTDEMQLSPDLANGVYANGKTLSTLEKILYSMLWKNRDLGKERHVISGILDIGHCQKHGTVFYEFGGYISGKNSYILDQHTLRCFAVHSSPDEHIVTARRLKVINGTNKKHIVWISLYKEFYNRIKPDILCDRSDFFYKVDSLLFGVGKLIKLE